MNWLRDRLPDTTNIAPIEETGLDSRYIEAEAFAVFGYLSLIGHPLGGAWTGARGFGPPGWITPGENWSDILRVLEKIRGAD
jgi:1,6-anhydro-N-acetylmuramate kinase